MPKPVTAPVVDSPAAAVPFLDWLSDGLTFTYGRVEAALAALHSIDEHSAGAFKGRIKHFQRLGIVPSSPGKGRKISYDFAAVIKWALCLELAQFGIAPEYIKLIVEARGDSVLAALREREPRHPHPLVLWLSPHLLSGPRDIETIAGLSGIAPLTEATAPLIATGESAGVLIINLTRIWWALIVWLVEDRRREILADDQDNDVTGRLMSALSRSVSRGAAEKK